MESAKRTEHHETCNHYCAMGEPCDCGADPSGTAYWALMGNKVIDAVEKAVADALRDRTAEEQGNVVDDVCFAAQDVVAVAIDSDYYALGDAPKKWLELWQEGSRGG